MADTCTDKRFEVIEKYKQKLIERTNIETAQDEMAVIDDILFRFWQMGWLPATQQEQQWIPCSERLPEESGDYLVTVAHHSGELWVEVDQFDNANRSWWLYMDDDVIAWTELPEPYKGEES